MNSNYQLAGTLQTTGWNPNFDVNATNEYGMTPAEVALQAGNLNEFVEMALVQIMDEGRTNQFMCESHSCC